MIHEMRLQAWADRPVLVCTTCKSDTYRNGLPLLRSNTVDGLSYAEVVRAAEAHLRTSGSAVVAVSERLDSINWGEHQDAKGTETPAVSEPELVAFGDAEEYPVGYHPRTGQQLESGYHPDPETRRRTIDTLRALAEEKPMSADALLQQAERLEAEPRTGQKLERIDVEEQE